MLMGNRKLILGQKKCDLNDKKKMTLNEVLSRKENEYRHKKKYKQF